MLNFYYDVYLHKLHSMCHLEIFNTAIDNYINHFNNLLGGKYDLNSRMIWHVLIWTPIQNLINYEFNNIKPYLYKGKLYRVIKNKRIKIDDLICHCSYDLSNINQSNKLNNKQKYTWLILDTKDKYGFNVNKYLNDINQPNLYNRFENEIIFSISKENIIDKFYGTYAEFMNYLNNKDVS